MFDGCYVRKLYWLDGGAPGVRRKLARANLDGSDVETLVSDNLYSPLHLALSADEQLVCWTDQYTHQVSLCTMRRELKKQEQQRVAVGPGNAHFMSIRKGE